MLAVKYIFFAIISTIVNLAFQFFSFLLYEGFGALYIAMFAGTLAGLIVKYVLDKKLIFYHQVEDGKDDVKKFTIYSIMGVFTTIIFWGVEMTFHYLFSNPNSKYIGAIIGLSIGYVIKYFLDKKYVFVYKEKGIA